MTNHISDVKELTFKQLQEKAKLSNKECKDLFAVSIRCIEKWRVENPKAPKAVIISLRYLIKHGSI